MVGIFHEVRRVLADDGTLWLNIGDCYHSGGRGGYRLDAHRWEKSELQSKRADRGGSGIPLAPNRLPQKGLKDKDLVGIPWLLAFALRDAGWWLRCPIIWHKPNGMPSSQKDRPTLNYEFVFLLSKRASYYYDHDAITEPVTYGDHPRNGVPGPDIQSPGQVKQSGITKRRRSGNKERVLGPGRARPDSHFGGLVPWEDRNGKRTARAVWTIPVQPYAGAHFAAMPPELARRCILAGSAPGDTVLDPFGGSGTTAAVAVGHGRSAIHIDLSPAYLELARQRVGPMLCEVVG
jgi:DNA modification methylase